MGIDVKTGISIRALVLLIGIWPFALHAAIQGGVETKTTHYDNFNLAYGAAEPISETVKTVDANLTVFKASSKDIVWLLKGLYNYSEYDRYAYLTGSSVTLLGGVFYRFSGENSLTLEAGKRERNYDSDDLTLYEDDAWMASLKFSHRLSSTTLMNEKIGYEMNETKVDSNHYHIYSGQLWFEWGLGGGATLSMGYSYNRRLFEYSDTEYTFEEPYMYLSYGLTSNIYLRAGYSKIKVTDQLSTRAYNETSYLAIGLGF